MLGDFDHDRQPANWLCRRAFRLPRRGPSRSPACRARRRQPRMGTLRRGRRPAVVGAAQCVRLIGTRPADPRRTPPPIRRRPRSSAICLPLATVGGSAARLMHARQSASALAPRGRAFVVAATRPWLPARVQSATRRLRGMSAAAYWSASVSVARATACCAASSSGGGGRLAQPPSAKAIARPQQATCRVEPKCEAWAHWGPCVIPGTRSLWAGDAAANASATTNRKSGWISAIS